MKRTAAFQALLFFLGFVLGAGLLFLTLTRGWLPNTRVTITTGASSRSVNTIDVKPFSAEAAEAAEDPADHAVILSRAMETAELLRDLNWSGLAGIVHPVKGVTFTAYSAVSPDDRCFTAEEVAAFGSDSRTYHWGYADGSGMPLVMTPAEYFGRYVNNADYTQAPYLAVNRVISSGNAVENVADAYPDGVFAELYYNSLDAANEGFDWCGLKLVFEPYEGRLMLVGVIHSEWTI